MVPLVRLKAGGSHPTDNPHRVGKRLRPPLQDHHSARRGTYRVIYRIDDEQHRVTVVFNRSDAYRFR